MSVDASIARWLAFAACLMTSAPIRSAQGTPPTAQAEEWIQRFDRSGDQKLDATELSEALSAKPVPPEELEKLEFVRVRRSERGTPQAMDTAIVSFTTPDGKTQVDLIGAVHVGDAGYYEVLNQKFKAYDTVLYELIAPKGMRVPRQGAKSDHPVSHMQQSIRSMLDLTFQLEEIDYTAKNFVHADMSPEEFAKSMKDRDESFLKLLFRMMGQANTQAQSGKGPSDLAMLRALLSKDRPLHLKRVIATQFEDLEAQMSVLEGPEGSTLITERNKRALSVLRDRLNQGEDRVAIFYGAGHLPDMANRLRNEFGMTPTKTDWLTAWDMSGARVAPQGADGR